jgi:hypothetical protein
VCVRARVCALKGLLACAGSDALREIILLLQAGVRHGLVSGKVRVLSEAGRVHPL